MSTDDKKPWERPWTTQEMIENASNWNLAGDAGLLKYLEDFSEKMLTKVKDTNDRLNDLIDSAEETSLALNNATNRFMGLRNTQFIESRVYEDDETLPIKSTEKEEKPKPTETERLEEMKQAIVNGLDIIDKYYEKVEIPESDSEDESSEPNIVYKPVDPYSDRPLPYVIGTAEWHKYWHVGLGHSSSDSEVENEEEQFSESESEQDVKILPNRDRVQIPGLSDSESEDYSKNKMSRPVANSTFNDQTTKQMFDSSSDSETGSLPPQVNTVNSNFAEELAAKLGKVESSNIEVEVNTKPIKKPSTSNIPGGLFSDEPPPLDADDMFVTKNITSDLFSGGNGLFDDDDDNDFWNTKPAAVVTKPISEPVKKPVENKDLFAEDNETDDIFVGTNKPTISESKTEKPKNQPAVKKPLGLFDDDDDNDDDNIFNTSSITQTKKSIFAPPKTSAPIVREEPPELDQPIRQESSSSKNLEPKKPVDGVSILGPNVLLNSKIFQKRAPSSSDSDNDSDKNSNESKKPITNEPPVLEEPKKIPSLFDDSSPLFSDDIFGNSSVKKFSSKLFEPEDQVEEKSDLFRNEPPPLEKGDDDFEDELFSNNDKNNVSKIPDIEVTKTSKKSLSLFDNTSDDDLFASISSKKGHNLFDPNPPILDTSRSNKSKSVNLFDPNPPDLDESDNKSESQLSDDPASYGSMNAGRAFLYDTEPPMLSNESSGIARDQSTRFVSEDSSFNPYLSSSRRHSDNFEDTQTADSLLTTRNKISFGADTTEKSNLSGIPEIDSMTKIDITASGNESSLNNDDDSSVFHSNISTEVEEAKPSIAQKPLSLSKKEDESSLFNDENSSVFKKNMSFVDKEKEENPSLFSADSSILKSNISTVFKGTKPNLAQKPSLFDEDSPILKSNISSEIEEIKPSIAQKPSLFGDEDSLVFNSSISTEFEGAKLSLSNKEENLTKKPSLFDDEDNTVFKTNISIDEDSPILKSNISTEKVKEDKPSIPKKPNVINEENIFNTTETSKTKNLFVDSDSDDDLFSNKSSGSKNSSTSDINNSSMTKPTTLKNKNIFESDSFTGPNLEGIPDIDLFKKDNNQNRGPDKDSKNLFGQILDIDTKNKENDNKKFNYEENLKSDEDIKIDPKKSLSFEKNIETEKCATKEEPDGTSPGKLKHNLNINVAALLPGASPPRKQNFEKSVSLDSSESQNQSSSEEVVKPRQPKPLLEKSASFESPVEHNEILSSAVKERAKIPVKRRPSTRRARQEAIRKSAADLKLEDAILENKSENIFNITNNNITENKPQNIKNEAEEKIKNPLLNPLSPSTDEEDFLTMPTEKDLSDNFIENSLFGKAPIISPVDISSSREFIKKKSVEKIENKDDLFDILKSPQNLDLFGGDSNISKPLGDTSIFSSSDSENDLFNTPKLDLKKPVTKTDTNNILSSPDEDLFKPKPKEHANTSSKKSYDDLFKDDDIFIKKKSLPKTTVTKKSLFDDDDDDDIFGSSSTSLPKSTRSAALVAPSSTTVKKPGITKLKKMPVDAVEDILDPLEALKK